MTKSALAIPVLDFRIFDPNHLSSAPNAKRVSYYRCKENGDNQLPGVLLASSIMELYLDKWKYGLCQ